MVHFNGDYSLGNLLTYKTVSSSVSSKLMAKPNRLEEVRSLVPDEQKRASATTKPGHLTCDIHLLVSKKTFLNNSLFYKFVFCLMKKFYQ